MSTKTLIKSIVVLAVICLVISGALAVVNSFTDPIITAAAIMAIVIAFINPFVAFVNTIPPCVMGGVCMALYGFIAVSGLKMLQPVDLNSNKNLFQTYDVLHITV